MTGKLMATAALTALTATSLWSFDRSPDVHLLKVKPIAVWTVKAPIKGCFK